MKMIPLIRGFAGERVVESAVKAKFQAHFQSVDRVFRIGSFLRLSSVVLMSSQDRSQIISQIQLLGLGSILDGASHVLRAGISCRMPPCSPHGNSCKAAHLSASSNGHHGCCWTRMFLSTQETYRSEAYPLGAFSNVNEDFLFG